MSGVTRVLGSVLSFVVWSVLLSPVLAFGADATLVQQIGEVSSEVADAVGAPGEAFVLRGRPGQAGGLSGAERQAIRQAYEAGQTILLLHASVHDIEALHVLVKDGVTHTSTTDPTVLAYALRQENNIPTVRIVHNPRPSLREAIDPNFEDEGAPQRALDAIIGELTHPPVLAVAPRAPAAGPVDWGQTPVQSNVITATGNGNYNTPIDIYALHSCQGNQGKGFDYYLVNTGGDWTATDAAWTSASTEKDQIRPDFDDGLIINYEPGVEFCGADNAGERICVYIPYPLWYEVDIVPPDLGQDSSGNDSVVQVNAAPAGDQGRSASYTSGFSFSIGGGVTIDGDGPGAGFQAGASWNNEVSTTVPPLVIEAGDTGPGTTPQGTFTRYQYCTVGTTPEDCTSNIQLIDVNAPCKQNVAGQPQQGQTPNGRLSNVAQTVNWRVDPNSYRGNTTFDVTVTWSVNIVGSQALFWWGDFADPDSNYIGPPSGSCNFFACSCSFPIAVGGVQPHSLTFKVPIPSQNCSGG
jgi:hypothetical protein